MSLKIRIPEGLSQDLQQSHARRWTGYALQNTRASGSTLVEVQEGLTAVEISWKDGTTVVVAPTSLPQEEGVLALPQLGGDRDGEGASAVIEVVLHQATGQPAHSAAVLVAKRVDRAEEIRAGKLLLIDENGMETSFTLTHGDPSPASAPALLLLHGTFNRTAGTFKDLFDSEHRWADLHKRYAGRTWGFDHPTLGANPIENATALVGLLPEGSVLDVLSQSRGGLVADVLAAACDRGALLPNGEIFTDLNEAFLTLRSMCQDRKIVVRRVARIASPSAGTTLASERLDIFLNVLLNAIGLLPALRTSNFFGLVKEFLIAFVSERTDPTALPGLAALVPEGLFIRWLSRIVRSGPGGEPHSDQELYVLRGDASRLGWVQRVISACADLAFHEANDLVVDLASMDRGPGLPADVRDLRDARQDRVDHFSYFINKHALDWLAEVLRAGASEQPKRSVEAAGSRGGPEAASAQRDVVVFLVPDCFGTEIRDLHERTIWPSRSTAGSPWLDSTQSKLGPVVEQPWSTLKDALGRATVKPVPWDWRLGLDAAASAIEAALAECLLHGPAGEPELRPIIVAHGAGALGVRMLLSGNGAGPGWKAFSERLKGQSVLLGAPHEGTWRAAEHLAKGGRLTQLLAMTGEELDLTVAATSITDAFRKVSGLYQLLPKRALEPDWWAAPLRHEVQPYLDQAKGVRGRLADPWSRPEVIDVIGHAPETPCEAASSDGPWLVLPVGDGQVPGPSGHLNHSQVEAPHGKLPQRHEIVAAITHLAETGRWPLQIVPADPGAVHSSRSRRASARSAPLFPIDTDLIDAALDGASPRNSPRLTTVVVEHGSVALVDESALVVHVGGPPLQPPEPELDIVLNGELTRHLRLGSYAGLESRTEIVPWRSKPGSPPRYVIVAGIMDSQDLTRAHLISAMKHSIVDLAVRQGPASVSQIAFAPPFESPLTSTEYVSAVLEAVVQANRRLVEPSASPAAVRQVRIVVPFGEYAADAMRAARRWCTAPTIPLEPDEEMACEVPARVRTRSDIEPFLPERPPPSSPRPRFQHISIRHRHEDRQEILEYVLSGSMANAPRVAVTVGWQTATALAARLTTESLVVPHRNQALVDQLMPREIQLEFRSGQDILLVLDRDTAVLPWEAFIAGGVDAEAVISGAVAILRQLDESAAGSGGGRPVQNKRVLVVCHPGSGDNLLAWARQEAVELQDAFERRGYEVIQSAETMADVLEALASPHEIVHFVGHGTQVTDDPLATGFLLADGILSRFNLGSIVRAPPSLVFINACSLGRLNAGDPAKIAADFASALIKGGVRAVVAAGWSVNDKGAMAFADGFYNEMLSGGTFREAVARGRVAARKVSPDTATWAAYQCYGDPGFILPSANRSARDDSYDQWLLRRFSPERSYTKRELEDLAGTLVMRVVLHPSDTALDEEQVERLHTLQRCASDFFDAAPSEQLSGVACTRVGFFLEQLESRLGVPQYPSSADKWFGRAALTKSAPLAVLDRLRYSSCLRLVSKVFDSAATLADEQKLDLQQAIKRRLPELGPGGPPSRALLSSGPDEGSPPAETRILAARARLNETLRSSPQWGKVGPIALPRASDAYLERLALCEETLADHVAGSRATGRDVPSASDVVDLWRRVISVTDVPVLTDLQTWVWEVIRSMLTLPEQQKRAQALVKELQRRMPYLLDDQNLGRYPSNQRDGYTLTAHITGEKPPWTVTVAVNVPGDASPAIILRLHPHLGVPSVQLRKETSPAYSYVARGVQGSFTVLAEIRLPGDPDEEEPRIGLALDLGLVPGAPVAFRRA